MIPLQTGDIILTHTHSWSDLLSMLRFRSWWTHAAMVYDPKKTVEMTNKNVRHLTIEKRYANKKIRVIRLRNLTIVDRVRLRVAARTLYHTKFDRLRLILPLLPQMRYNYYWCTSFIDLVYKKALGRTINVKWMMQSKKDYLEAIQADIIYDYRNK